MMETAVSLCCGVVGLLLVDIQSPWPTQWEGMGHSDYRACIWHVGKCSPGFSVHGMHQRNHVGSQVKWETVLAMGTAHTLSHIPNQRELSMH